MIGKSFFYLIEIYFVIYFMGNGNGESFYCLRRRIQLGNGWKIFFGEIVAVVEILLGFGSRNLKSCESREILDQEIRSPVSPVTF